MIHSELKAGRRRKSYFSPSCLFLFLCFQTYEPQQDNLEESVWNHSLPDYILIECTVNNMTWTLSKNIFSFARWAHFLVHYVKLNECVISDTCVRSSSRGCLWLNNLAARNSVGLGNNSWKTKIHSAERGRQQNSNRGATATQWVKT